ncbi:MAG: hypothetical protein ABEJ42_10430 [Halobacteriaceae archaeon]
MVGVALLVGVTAVAIAALTAGVGTVVESGATGAEVQTAARGLAAVLEPGAGGGTVTLATGSLSTVERDVRVLAGDRVVYERGVGALTYRHAEGPRVVGLAGAVLHGRGTSAGFSRAPTLRAATGGDASAVYFGLVDLVGRVDVEFDRRRDVRVRAATDRRRTAVEAGTVAVETTTPGPWRAVLERRGATVTRRDVDGDGVASVVADFEVDTVYVSVRAVEVSAGG